MKIVVKIGGSMAIGDRGPNSNYMKKLISVLLQIKKKHQLIVSIGGGKWLRHYYTAIDPFVTGKEKEWIAVNALLRANVLFMGYALGMKPLWTLSDIKKSTSGVIGGIVPGRSTDANAAIAATTIGGMLVKLTNVNGVYDKDPNKFKGAKRIKHIPVAELKKYAIATSPGSYGVLDPTCIKTIQKHKIKTIVMSGKDPSRILDVLSGRKLGTLIS